MIHVPKDDRVIPLTEITYLERSQADLFQDLLQLKRVLCPSWTDESEFDFGVQLLNLFATLQKWVVDNMERLKRNAYVATVENRDTMAQIARLFGYNLREATPAGVTLTFSCTPGHPQFTIPKLTQVATQSTSSQDVVIFETDQDTVVGVGVNSIAIVATEGQTIANEIVGQSDGTTNQIFALDRKGVIWQSEKVEVHDGSSWVVWTRVDDFADSTPTSKHYRVAADENQIYSIIFSDGKFGDIPLRGENNLRVSYRIGGGEGGNVAAGSLANIVTPVTYVEGVTNAAAAFGGTGRESLERARIAYRQMIKSLNRAVSFEDYKYFAESYTSPLYGSVAKAGALTPGGSMIQVPIVPIEGGMPSAALKAAVETYLETVKTLCTNVSVIDPVYIAINVTTTVYALPGFGATTVKGNVTNALFALLSPTYKDPVSLTYPNEFGRDVRLSDLYRAIGNAEGVDYCTIAIPTTDTMITPDKIANVGTFSITVVTP